MNLTTLRREVLRDILGEEGLRRLIASLGGTNRVGGGMLEAGGSGGETVEDNDSGPDDDNDVLDSLLDGVDYGAEPADGYFDDATQLLEFATAAERFENMDIFLRYIAEPFVYGLRVTPGDVTLVDPDDALHRTRITVRRTGRRPFIHKGIAYTYGGGVLDLASHIPNSGEPDKEALLMLDPLAVPANNAFDTSGAAIKVITDAAVIADPKQWNRSYVPLAILKLKFAQKDPADPEDPKTGIEIGDCIDVRPMVSWLNGPVFKEKLWFDFTANGNRTYALDTGSVPATPFDVNCRLFRNGQELTYGLSYDYTMAKNNVSGNYEITLTFDIETGERLKLWYLEG